MIKKLVRYCIIGATFFFIFTNFKEHWHNINEISWNRRIFYYLILSLLITSLAHIWSGYVWTFILKIFKQSLPLGEALKIYLVTNLYKYLPGNVGHLYGRIKAVSSRGVPIEAATLSVLLEPLLMAASALFITILSGQLGLIKTGGINLGHFLFLGVILMSCHPIILDRVMKGLRRLRKKEQDRTLAVREYPFLPLGGEIIFVLLRGVGFLIIWQSFSDGNIGQILPLLSAFSFAWLLGLVVPGAPGGLGVFEATMIALLDKQEFPAGTVLLVVALYRAISIVAEVLGAGVGLLCGRSAPDTNLF